MELKQGKEMTFDAEEVSIVFRRRGSIFQKRPEINEEILTNAFSAESNIFPYVPNFICLIEF